MSAPDWLAQLSRLNYFAGQLAARDPDGAAEACDSVRQLANILEQMVHTADTYQPASMFVAPRSSGAPSFGASASIPYHACTLTKGDASILGDPYYKRVTKRRDADSMLGLMPTDASYSPSNKRTRAQFERPHTIASPPPDFEALSRSNGLRRIAAKRDVSTTSTGPTLLPARALREGRLRPR